VRRANPKKTEIKIVFQHPNLLYLSEKREKTREEVSREVEEKIINSMNRRKYSNFRTEGRPYTSDMSAAGFGGFRN
jgi:hypothetical protein